jgi:hypothetical protein
VNHSTSREAAAFSSPVRERGVRSLSELERRRCDTCDTHEAGVGPPGLDDLFVDDPRPYGTWLLNVGPFGPLVAARAALCNLQMTYWKLAFFS